jgi:hypothetical protein
MHLMFRALRAKGTKTRVEATTCEWSTTLRAVTRRAAMAMMGLGRL